MSQLTELSKKITAQEARQLMTTSKSTLNHIYKSIKDCATNNEDTLDYRLPSNLVESEYYKMIETLTNDGFSVVDASEILPDIYFKYTELEISWK